MRYTMETSPTYETHDLFDIMERLSDAGETDYKLLSALEEAYVAGLKAKQNKEA